MLVNWMIRLFIDYQEDVGEDEVIDQDRDRCVDYGLGGCDADVFGIVVCVQFILVVDECDEEFEEYVFVDVVYQVGNVDCFGYLFVDEVEGYIDFEDCDECFVEVVDDVCYDREQWVGDGYCQELWQYQFVDWIGFERVDGIDLFGDVYVADFSGEFRFYFVFDEQGCQDGFELMDDVECYQFVGIY